MKKRLNKEIWEFLVDTPEEFDEAIANAITPAEKEFFEKLKYKVVHEPACSNDVMMTHEENADRIYILRISDGFIIGKMDMNERDEVVPIEYGGLFNFLNSDIHQFTGKHGSVWEWLRDRDYAGIRYDRNNDYL